MTKQQRGPFPLTPHAIRSIVRRVADYAGLDWVTTHTLRRTYATHLNRAGVPLPEIRKLLGHASIKTTVNYIEPDVEGVRDQIEKVLDI